MWKRWRWVVGGLAALLAGVLLLFCAPQRHDLTRQDFKRLRLGMTLAQVEAVLGPPGDYRTGVCVSDTWPREENWLAMQSLHGDLKTWESDAAIIVVGFDRGEAICGSFRGSRLASDNHLVNDLWRAERAWRHWFR